MQEILEKIVTLFEEENQGSMCSILILDRSGERLLHGAAPSMPKFYNDAIHGLRIGEGVGSCGTAAYTKRPVVVADVFEHPYWKDFRELAARVGFRSCWSIPIFSSTNKVLGTFAIYHRFAKMPTQEENKWVLSGANFASLVIEKQQAQEILQESEASYRTLANNLPCLVYRARFQGDTSQISFFNDMLFTMTGYTSEDLTINNVSSIEPLILEEDRNKILEKVRISMDTDSPFEVEYRIRHRDGSIRYFNEHGRCIRGTDGKPSYIDGVIFDVTVRRETEDSLQKLYEQTQRDAKTKSDLLREINHRVKNNLISILGLLLTEQRYVDPDTRKVVKRYLDNVASRIRGLIEVHRLLSESEWAPMRLDILAQNIISGVLNTFTCSCEPEIKITNTLLVVSPRQANHIALVLNELAFNTLKYGIAGRNSVKVCLDIQVVSEGICMIYRDDGPGYPPTVLEFKQKRVGIHLIHELVEKSLRGAIQLMNENGAVAHITIKTEEIDRT